MRISSVTVYCSIHDVAPPSIQCTLTNFWMWGEHQSGCSPDLFSLCKLWASVLLVQTVAHLTALSHAGYKRWRVAGSLVHPSTELCLQWNQRIFLTMRLLIQTFTICLALFLCLAAPSWVLLSVHFRTSTHLCESLFIFLPDNLFFYSINICICSIILLFISMFWISAYACHSPWIKHWHKNQSFQI